MAEILADNYSVDDRRRVVGAGVRHGRDAQIVDMRAIAEVWITNVASTVLAVRGERLALIHVLHSYGDQQSGAFHTDALVVSEINEDERIVGAVSFDVDDIDAAFEELDRRYLAGEAAVQAHTWSVIVRAYASLNRGVIPETTQDWVHIDHRLYATIGAGDTARIPPRGMGFTPDLNIHAEEVHKLSDIGAIVTHASHGSSQEGFDVEWRMIELLTVDGDKINRCELFDEAEIDAALTRFEELQPPARQLEMRQAEQMTASSRTSGPAIGRW